MDKAPEDDRIRIRLHVHGVVQGVGFRPFVWREATARGLSGWVANDEDGVVLEAEGTPDLVAALVDALHDPPPLARVARVSSERRPPSYDDGFAVRGSTTSGALRALVPPDAATCADCLRELDDPLDRRHGYAFINCTSCGPRYTIVGGVPYDRARTTMSDFEMCAECRAEYSDPQDRRFHAEPVCCPRCGPALRFLDRLGGSVEGDPLQLAVGALAHGKVLALKGLGGYHLAVDARDESAVAALRSRKGREARPFAVMVPGLDAAERIAPLGPTERDLLTGPERPIVLVECRDPDALAPSVAPSAYVVGLMLPYTPLHTLLLRAVGGPLVLTSGNRSHEPIVCDDADALVRLRDVADGFLTHDRRIQTRTDDSVVTAVRGRALAVRRSRGYVPRPVELAHASEHPVLACGAALKNTFCVTRGRDAFVSEHIGDLDDYLTFEAYVDAISRLTRLLDVRPRVVAHDLHPDYPSTRHAMSLSDVDLVPVQHHHAHIASCLADNARAGPVIGVALDGLGLGDDATAWGGEFLVADLRAATRVGHLAAVPMPGGDAATRQPWRMAAAYLDLAYEGDVPTLLEVARRQGQRWGQVVSVARTGLASPPTSSAGRLFDAVSAILGVRDVVSYEGQAAVELEALADRTERGSYGAPLGREANAPVVVDTVALVREVTDDLLSGTSVPIVAARFHNSLGDVVLEVCRRVREEHGLPTVALSGGVFQNRTLLGRCLDVLEADGFDVLTHRTVPCNDGGISLGQAAVAAATRAR